MKLKLVHKGGPGSGHHGHKGRPGKRGGSLPGKGRRGGGVFSDNLVGNVLQDDDHVESSEGRARRKMLIEKYLVDYVDSEVENGTIMSLVDDDNIESFVGSEEYISLPSDFDYSLYDEGKGIFIHNHPMPYALSIGDVIFAMKRKLREMIVVTRSETGEKMIYSIKPGFVGGDVVWLPDGSSMNAFHNSMWERWKGAVERFHISEYDYNNNFRQYTGRAKVEKIRDTRLASEYIWGYICNLYGWEFDVEFVE